MVPVSQHGGESTIGNSTVQINKLASGGSVQVTQRSIPPMKPGVKCQQRSRSCCAEHLKTPPATAEQPPSNIAASRGRPQHQRRATKEPAVNNPEVVVEGRPAEQRWTAHRAPSKSV